MTVARAWRDIKAALAEQSMDAIVASLRPPAAPEDPAEGRRAEPALRVRDPRRPGPGVRRGAAPAGPRRHARLPAQRLPRPLRRRLRLRLRRERFVSIMRTARSPPEDGIEDDDTHDIQFAANYDGSWRFVASANDGSLRLPTGGATARQCSPTTASGSRAAAPETHNAFAQWFATYAARVRLRAYRVAPLMPDAPDGTRKEACSSPTATPATTATCPRPLREAFACGRRRSTCRTRRRATPIPSASDACPTTHQKAANYAKTLAHQRRRAHVDRERRGRRGQVPRAHIDGWRDDSQFAAMTSGDSIRQLDEKASSSTVLLGHDARPRGGSLGGLLYVTPGRARRAASAPGRGRSLARPAPVPPSPSSLPLAYYAPRPVAGRESLGGGRRPRAT